MGETTEIGWTDATFNPWIGCQKVSPGCDNCYAETQNGYRGWTQWGPHGERRRTSASNWRKPHAWNAAAESFLSEHGRRRRVFSASLADVMDNAVDPATRADFFRTVRETPNLDWLILTKRPQNYARFLPEDWGGGYPNVWLGFTAEDDVHYRARWKHVRDVPAVVRFVSYEPALGPLSLDDGIVQPDWVICGGESGPGARVMEPGWARAIRDLCVSRGIAFFHKQFGSYASNPLVREGSLSVGEAREADPNAKGGETLDGRTWREFPEARMAA